MEQTRAVVPKEKSKFVLRDRKVARWISGILVALAILGGASSSIRGVVAETEAAFVYGVNGDGQSIFHDLYSRTGLAYNMIVVAERYLPADDGLITELRLAADRLSKQTEPGKCYDANRRLTVAMDTLNTALGGEALSEQDEDYRKGIMTDFASFDYIIAHDGYNELVRECNEDELGEFPAKLLRIITFTPEAEYYR
jgi:hypothetical protein